jgi:hypothetical protein
VSIPRPGRGQALIIADGRVMVVSLAELEQLKRGDTGIPDEPIASVEVSAANFDEAVERVLRLLSGESDD